MLQRCGWMFLLTAGCALATAQSLTSRVSTVNFSYVFGAGGDSHSDNQTLTETDLVSNGFSGRVIYG